MHIALQVYNDFVQLLKLRQLTNDMNYFRHLNKQLTILSIILAKVIQFTSYIFHAPLLLMTDGCALFGDCGRKAILNMATYRFWPTGPKLANLCHIGEFFDKLFWL